VRISLMAACVLIALPVCAAPLKTERVVLITIDGLRLQEVFTGMDAMFLPEESKEKSGIDDLPGITKRFWRETPEERREVLLPFFWGEMAQRGVVLGNPAKGGSVTVTNIHKFSFPGYSEILTGAAQSRVWSNGKFRSPVPTVLEYVQQEMKLDYKGVAAFCSWEIFNWIASREEDPFYTNAGYEAVPAELLTPGMQPLNDLQFKMLTPWDSVRFDSVTSRLAFEYLKANQPKVMLLSLGETDDWGHNRRYDRVLHAAQLFDEILKELWETLESLDAYRGKTTIIITGDHGRGITLEDWTNHGRETPGSEHIWTAVFGPDTPAQGEVGGAYTQGQAAPTLAKFLGLDYKAFYPESTEPLDVAFAAE